MSQSHLGKDGKVSFNGIHELAKGVQGKPYSQGYGVKKENKYHGDKTLPNGHMKGQKRGPRSGSGIWGDCSSSVSVLANYVSGKDPWGARTTTASIGDFLESRGFLNGKGGKGSLTVAWYRKSGKGHTVAQMPDGNDFEMTPNYGLYGTVRSPINNPKYNKYMHIPASRFGQGGSAQGSESSQSVQHNQSSGQGGITVGSSVNVTGTNYATGQKIPGWVKNMPHVVSRIDGQRALLGANGGICSWVNLSDLKLVGGGDSKQESQKSEAVQSNSGGAVKVTLDSNSISKNAWKQVKKGYETYSSYVKEGVSVKSERSVEMEALVQEIEKKKDIIGKLAAAINAPPELVAAIWYREGSLKEGVYFHNGEKLGQYTQKEPKGLLFPDTPQGFIDAAVDAFKREQETTGINLSVNMTDLAAMAVFSERYNGFGYQNKGQVSPYVMAGTSKYGSSGMYVDDGKYDANSVDNRFGTYAIMKALMDRGTLRASVSGSQSQQQSSEVVQKPEQKVDQKPEQKVDQKPEQKVEQSGSSALQKLLSSHPQVKINQDLINLFYRMSDNTYNGAAAKAREYGVDMSDLVKNRQGTVNGSSSTPVQNSEQGVSDGTAAGRVVEKARSFVDNPHHPYVWGGKGQILTKGLINGLAGMYGRKRYSNLKDFHYNGNYRAFDCSGLCCWSYKNVLGMDISEGHGWRPNVSKAKQELKNAKEEQLKVGDVVKYSGHYAIYIGGGKVVESTGSSLAGKGNGVHDTRSWNFTSVQTVYRYL